MRRSRLGSVAAVVLTVAMAGGILVDLEALAAAMACCGATDYECATLGAPDDCCQSMGHVAGSVAAAPPSKSIAGPTFAAAVVSALAVGPVDSFSRRRAPLAFKPPHSPPPLTSAPLRI